MGSSTYTTLSDLLAPETPGTKTYVEISTKLKDHFLPKRSTIAERFHFHKRDQAAGESVAEYDAALRKLAVNCKFGTNLQDTLRDRFVCGLRHEAIQRRLLSESTLTYATATETARAMEAADKDTRAFRKWSFSFVEISTYVLVPGVSGASRSLRVVYVDDPILVAKCDIVLRTFINFNKE